MFLEFLWIEPVQVNLNTFIDVTRASTKVIRAKRIESLGLPSPNVRQIRVRSNNVVVQLLDGSSRFQHTMWN